MEFKRVNSDTVRCIITQEDMIEYDVKIEDFIKNSDNLHEFLHVIVERASEEVGYEPKDMNTLSMQVMPLSNNRLAITLSENSGGSINDLVECIKETINELDPQVAKEIEKLEKNKGNTKDNITDNTQEAERYVRSVVFDTYETLEKYVVSLDDTTGMNSSLYYDETEQCYILILKKGRASKEKFAKAIGRVVDYALSMTDYDSVTENVMEHCRCIMGAKAIATIKKLA